MTDVPAISMQNISFSYGLEPVLDDFNLDIEAGQVHCLVGSSGSGKTTALRIMNGLLRPQEGRVLHGGEEFDFSQAELARRKMGYSIQGSGLFPHMTLHENLTIIAKKEGWTRVQIDSRVRELCQMVNLPSSKPFLQKRPREISGGQQQRLGIARALFMNPKVILMDEPFSALDPITRKEIQNEFLSLQKKLQTTIVLVTHDLSEAFRMAHQIVLLNKGRIEQKGRPSKFLLNPASRYVEEFMDSHSPGNILKEVFLYSVVNTGVFVSQKHRECVHTVNVETKAVTIHKNQEEATRFLTSENQMAHYWVDENFRFIHTQSFEGHSSNESLPSTDNILKSMIRLLNTGLVALPVVNHHHEMVGVFSQEALDAL